MGILDDLYGSDNSSPSAAYIADKSAKFPGQGVPGNPRPSEYHWWIPGMGWSFMPEYDEGNNLQQQYAALSPFELDKAMAQGYTHQMSAGAQAVADQLGTTVTTGPAYGYTAKYPENAFTVSYNTATPSTTTGTTTTATPAGPAYTAADVNALYNQYLNRDAEEAGLNYWLNSLNTGTSMEDVVYNIMQSDEYKSLQGQAGTTNSTEPPDSTGLPPVVDNESSGNVLTAAGLASALSMLIPKQTPAPPAKTGVMGPSSGGTFNPAPIQTLNYSSPSLAPIGSSNKIDYVKQMRAGLFKDLV